MRRRALMQRAAASALAAALPRRFAVAAPERSRVPRIVRQAGLTSLDPIWTTALVRAIYSYNVYDTLFTTDAKFRPKPQMACARAIALGEAERAGRWWWEEEETHECGLHRMDGRLVPHLEYGRLGRAGA